MAESLDFKLLKELMKMSHECEEKLEGFKKVLPDDCKGFIDLQLKNLNKAYTELLKDIDFYTYGNKPDDLKLKSFKIHCANRFLPIVILSEPKNILSYGITYQEYITPNNKDR